MYSSSLFDQYNKYWSNKKRLGHPLENHTRNLFWLIKNGGEMTEQWLFEAHSECKNREMRKSTSKGVTEVFNVLQLRILGHSFHALSENVCVLLWAISVYVSQIHWVFFGYNEVFFWLFATTAVLYLNRHWFRGTLITKWWKYFHH